MNRRTGLILIGLAGLLAAVLVVIWLASGGDEDDPLAVAAGAVDAPPGEALRSVELYFPADGRRLYPEEREMPAEEDPGRMARAIVDALLAGPQTEGLRRPLPAGVTTANVYLDGRGILFLDLASPDRGPPPALGSMDELLTVYSLVDSVLLNVPEARSVVLLWNGAQRASFAGHIDTAYPLVADPNLVAVANP